MRARGTEEGKANTQGIAWKRHWSLPLFLRGKAAWSSPLGGASDAEQSIMLRSEGKSDEATVV